MPIAIIVVVALVCLPALYFGGRAMVTWAEYRDPDSFRDLVNQGTTTLLKFSLLLFMVTTGAVAVVGSIFTQRDGTALPLGVIVCAVIALAVGVGMLWKFGPQTRPRKDDAAR